MIKALVVDSTKLDGVSWWRNARPLSIMRKQFRDRIDIKQVTENVDIREVMASDVVIMFRPTSPQSLGFVHNCKALGAKIILDLDDDIWNLDPFHPAFGDFEGMRETARNIFHAADFVWCSTKQLQFAADCFGNSEVIPNAILPGDLPDKPAEWKGKGVAMWRGFNNQIADIMSPEAMATYEAARDLYDRWQFAGYLPPMAHRENVQYIRGVPPLVYFLNLQQTGANVFWKPLKDCKFNDAKSNIAWLEATMCGAVCVTNYAGREGWEYASPDFITNNDDAAKIWEASVKAILRDYNLLEVNERRFKTIENLLR